MSARKNYEVVLLAEQVSHDLFELLHIVMQVYHNDFQLYCTSKGIMFPPLGEEDGKSPALIRVVSRGGGDCTSVYSDMSSFELNINLYSININPYYL